MKETSEYGKCIMHKCEAQTKTTLKLTCTNMVLLDGSTCITSLLINFATIDSDQSLRSFLSQWDRKVVAVAADGKCLFRAISHLLFHHENAHWPLRNLIVRFENLNSQILQNRMTDINADTFAGHIRKLCN